MFRYFIAVLTVAACIAAEPAIAIQIRMISAESDRAITVEITDDQGQPVDGATVTFQSTGKNAVKAQTRADGQASIASAQLNPANGAFGVKITAVKDLARAGLIAHRTFGAAPEPPPTPSPAAKIETSKSEPVMPVTAGGDGDFKSGHSFHWKWLAFLGLAAGAGAGLYLKAQANSTITLSSPFLAAPQVGTPTITIGHP